jgi:hypothetical protein
MSPAPTVDQPAAAAPAASSRLWLTALGVISVTMAWQLALRGAEGYVLWHRWAYFWLLSIVGLLELAGPRFDALARGPRLSLTLLCGAAFIYLGGYHIPSSLFIQVIMLAPLGLFIAATRGVMTRGKAVLLIIATLGTMLSLQPLIAHLFTQPALARVMSIVLNVALASLVWHVAKKSWDQPIASSRHFLVLRALLFIIVQRAIVSWTPEGSLITEIISSRAFWLFFAAWALLDYFSPDEKRIGRFWIRSGWVEWISWLLPAAVWLLLMWVLKR